MGGTFTIVYHPKRLPKNIYDPPWAAEVVEGSMPTISGQLQAGAANSAVPIGMETANFFLED